MGMTNQRYFLPQEKFRLEISAPQLEHLIFAVMAGVWFYFWSQKGSLLIIRHQVTSFVAVRDKRNR